MPADENSENLPYMQNMTRKFHNNVHKKIKPNGLFEFFTFFSSQ